MDRNLIVPGPDYCWHVSEFLKQEADTDEGARWLAQFHGLSLKLPTENKLQPDQNALDWRLSRLK